MKIKICPKCKTKEVIKDLSEYDLELGCINYCGVARSKYVVIIDNKPIIAETKQELLIKIKEYK